MKYCHQCSQHLELGIERYCPNCGTDLQQQNKVKGERGAANDDKYSSIDIPDTKGGVYSAGFSGNENVIGKELGGYTRQGNVIHLDVNSLSSEILERVIKVPTQIDMTLLIKVLMKTIKVLKRQKRQ